MNKPMFERIEFIETIECVECYQLIDSRARRCPHCCSFLEKSPRLQLKQLKAFVLPLLIIAVSGWIAFWISYIKEDVAVFVSSPAKSELVAEPNKLPEAAPLAPAEEPELAEVPKSAPFDLALPERRPHFEYDAELVERILECTDNLIVNVACEF